MKKKKNLKKILLTNLPAAVTLILMAVALAVTVKFNFFLSLLVLVILYFVFGIIIEILLDKKQKKDDLYNQYKNASQVKTQEEEPDYDETTSEEEEEVSVAAEHMPEKADLASGAEAGFAESDDIEAAVVVGAVADYTEEQDEEDEQTAEESDEGDIEIIVKAPDEAEEAAEEAQNEAEEEIPAEEPAGDKAEETSEIKAESQKADDADNKGEEANEEGFEELSLESLMSGNLEISDTVPDIPDKKEDIRITNEFEIIEKSADSKSDEIISEVIPETEDEKEAIRIIEPTLEDDIEIVLTPAAGIDDEIKEKAIEDAKEVIAPVIQAREEEETSLKTALENIGVETTEEVVATAEAEARKSLFEDDEFEEANLPKAAPSIIFGSVPDTDDEFEYIPETSHVDTPVAPQRGKVKVDSKKIDDLYSFNKANKGERFFGKSRRN